MTPFNPGQDVFQTQADQRFNSFSSPLNSMNTNSGDWGMNSAYMTPSYTSPYRPRYQGPQGSQSNGYRPGFFRSLNHVINPFEGGGTNYGGNTYAQGEAYYSAIGMRPIDAGMHAMQNIVVPMAFSAMAYKHLAKPMGDIGERFGAGLMGRMGAGLGLGPAGASRLASLGGGVGKLAFGIGGPLMAAQVGMGLADSAFFDPYTAQRSSMDTLRRNTAGITYGEGTGNDVTGGGVSRRFAAQYAGNVSKMAARDVTFSQMEVSQLTDFAGRSGLMDNVSSSQMSKRMKEITSQVKTVMAVANTSDFREAIEIMSKLQSSGVGSQRLSGTMGAIGGLASAAGMSTQRLMNTVGAQGQYLYGANGLTPYVGQLTAGQAAASFGTAFRSGLMSPALMARMGGVEGASQSSNTGLLAALQSPYAMAIGMNAMHGGAVGSVVGNMSKFGGSMASNPLSAIGHMNMLRPALLSNMAENEGLHSVQMQLAQMGKMIPGALNNKGKMDTGVMYQLMTGMMGIQDTDARAMIEDFRGRLDPKGRRAHMASLGRAQQDFDMKFADQNSMNKGIFTRPYNAVLNFKRGMDETGSENINKITRLWAGASDYVEGGIVPAMYGESNRPSAVSLKDFNKKIGGRQINVDKAKAILATTGSIRDDLLKNGLFGEDGNITSLHAINKAAAKGDEDANALLNTNNRQERILHIKRLADKGVIDPKYAHIDGFNELDSTLRGAGTVSAKNSGIDPAKKIATAIKLSSGVDGDFKGMEVLSLAQKLSANPDDTAAMERISMLTGRDINSSNVHDEIKKIRVATATYGTGNIADIFDSLGSSSEELSAIYKDSSKIGGFLAKIGVSSSKNSSEFIAKVADKEKRNVLEKGLDPSKVSAMTEEEANRYISTTKGNQSQRAILDKMYRDNQFDFSEYTDSVNALDNKQSTLDFTAAVDKFGVYVESIVTGKPQAEIVKTRSSMIPNR